MTEKSRAGNTRIGGIIAIRRKPRYVRGEAVVNGGRWPHARCQRMGYREQAGTGLPECLLLLFLPLGRNAQAQGVQLDETFRVLLVVRPLVFLEGGDARVE